MRPTNPAGPPVSAPLTPAPTMRMQPPGSPAPQRRAAAAIGRPAPGAARFPDGAFDVIELTAPLVAQQIAPSAHAHAGAIRRARPANRPGTANQRHAPLRRRAGGQDDFGIADAPNVGGDPVFGCPGREAL